MAYVMEATTLLNKPGTKEIGNRLWAQLAIDLPCELPTAQAKAWLGHIPQAIRHQSFLRAKQSLTERFRIGHAIPSLNDLKDYITAGRASGERFGVPFDIVEQIVNTWGDWLTPGAYDETTLRQLQAAEGFFAGAAYRIEQSALQLAQADLLLRLKRFDDAQTLIQSARAATNGAGRFIADYLAARHTFLSGGMAPPFRAQITSTGGGLEQFSLAAYRGSVVVLDFWLSWCGPCRKHMKELQRIAKQYAAQKVIVIGVNTVLLEEDAKAPKLLLRELGVTYPQIIDDGTLSDLYLASTYPHCVVIGRDGKVAAYRPSADLSSVVRKLVAERKGE